MRIGLSGGAASASKMVEQAQRAEDEGFTSLWYASAVGGDPLVAMAMAGRAVRKASQVADAEGASGFARFGHMAKSLYAASEQARAEHPGASHARRIHSKLNSQLQQRKMDAAMQQQIHPQTHNGEGNDEPS